METTKMAFDAAFVADYDTTGGRRGLYRQGIELSNGEVEWLSGVYREAGTDLLSAKLMKGMEQEKEVLLLGVKVLRVGYMLGGKVVWEDGHGE